jgi:hypothetical protein
MVVAVAAVAAVAAAAAVMVVAVAVATGMRSCTKQVGVPQSSTPHD